MTDKDEFLAGLARRLRKLRLSLGYQKAASFARAIGYPPDKYSRYERRGILRTGVILLLVRAIKTSGHGQVSYDWLFDFSPPGPMFMSQRTPGEMGEARS